MRKILFVFNHPAPYKVRLLNELSSFYELDVIFERDNNNDRNKEFYAEKEYKFNLIKIKGLKIGNENILSFGVKNHIKKNKYDLIIMNGYSNLAELIAINYMIKHNIPYVLYINGGIIKEKESSFKKNLKTKYIKNAKYHFSPDEKSNEYLIHYGANPDKIYNYPYSTIYEDEISLSYPLKSEIEEVKNKYNIKAENIFVSVGQLIERKNYTALIKFWAEKNIKDHLLIIGEGKQQDELDYLIERFELNNVTLCGYLPKEEIFKIFKVSRAFIFPSKEDIYGHVVNEALSQGLPVITSSNVNSGLHLIKNKVNGFIVEDINSQSTLEALNYCLSHDLKANCIKTAKENTIEKMKENHIKIIEEEE